MALTPFAQKWVAALRSDEYKQGTGRLRGVAGFCCLGVACDLAVKEGIIGGYVGNDSDLENYPAVQGALGLRGLCGCYGGMSLVELNDHLNLPFEEIADIIESEPEGLFTVSEELS